MCLEGARALAAHPSHKRMCSSHVYRILECSCELCESASTAVGHAVTSLPSSHATQGGSTHVHDPQGSDRVFSCATTQGGNTPLIATAWWGYNDIVQELLKHGASVNIQDRVSQRPCMFPHLCKVLHSVFCWLLVCT